MSAVWRIGCSGFHYKHWRETFYPKGLPQRRWFEFYCEHFNTVELNVTFYRFPRLPALQEWYKNSPTDFRFTVKAPRFITHFWKFNNVQRQMSDLYTIVRDGLSDKLGAILFQLHPNFEYSPENLARMIDVMDPAFTNVIEFRHESWWRPGVVRVLKAAGISFSGISYPGLPDNPQRTSSTLYYRFHGVPELYKSSYSDAELKSVVGQISRMRGLENVFIYFNNDIDSAAVWNALTLQRLRSGKAPESISTFKN